MTRTAARRTSAVAGTARARLRALLGVALLGAWSLTAAAQATAAPWPEAASNPKPAPGDVVLPMPCDGAMVFRRIDVESANRLADRTIQIGEPGSEYGAVSGPVRSYMAGAFPSGDKRSTLRYYLIGKYEVTRQQFDAVFGRCASGADGERQPRVGLDWAEAADFSRRYTEWLAENALARLPRADGVPGFVRLPTEAEWEFAARGGGNVTEADFELPLFPMDEEPARYIWYAGSESSGNRLNVIGLLKPNPVGLHDVLGNAAEFVTDSFRVNRRSRWHGQSGGFVVKGGSFRSGLDTMSTGDRAEYVPMTDKGLVRNHPIGFRVVVSAPVIPGRDQLRQIGALWDALGTNAGGLSETSLADPVKEAKVLAAAVEDPILKRRIAALSELIAANVAQRDEQRDSAARRMVDMSALLINKMIEDQGRIPLVERFAKNKDLREDVRKPYLAQLAALEEVLRQNADHLLSVLRQLGREYPLEVVSAQAKLLEADYLQRKINGYGPLIGVVTTAVAEVAGGKPLDSEGLAKRVRALKQAGR